MFVKSLRKMENASISSKNLRQSRAFVAAGHVLKFHWVMLLNLLSKNFMYLNFYRVCHFVKKVTSRCKIKRIKTRYIMGFFLPHVHFALRKAPHRHLWLKCKTWIRRLPKKNCKQKKTSLCVVASAHCTLHFLDFIDRRIKVVCLRRLF